MTPEDKEKRFTAAREAHDSSRKDSHALMPAVAAFGAEALKTVTIVNGGAAAATLAYIGTGRQPVTLDIILALKSFGVGLLAAAIATAIGYLAQWCYLREAQSYDLSFERPFTQPNKWFARYGWAGRGLHVFTVALVAIAYGCACYGFLTFSGALVPSAVRV